MNALFVTLSLALVIAACGGGDDDPNETQDREPSADEPASTGARDDGRRQGGEITIAADFLSGIEPHAGEFTLSQMVWRGLYSVTPDNRVTDEQNGIADGLPEVSEDGLKVTVRLREGLTWSDGDDLRAEDYVAGIIRSCNPLVGRLQYLLANVEGCNDFYNADPASADLEALQAAVGARVVDPLTIEFSLEQPQPSFAAALALPVAFPVPVHLDRFAGATPDEPGDWGTDPSLLAYNGPYVLTEFAVDSRAVFEPSERWSGSIQPTLERVVFRAFAAASAALEAFRNGEVQLTRIEGEQVPGAPEEFGDEYFQEVGTTTLALETYLADGTLANLDVRLALARAIDRHEINQTILSGGFVPTTTWIPEVTSGLPPDSYEDVIGFDPEAARRHLAVAGYPGGEGFPTLGLITVDSGPGGLNFGPTAAVLQQGFKEILNIDIELEVLPEDAFLQRLTAGDFDLALAGWVQDHPDYESWILGVFETDGAANFFGCSDPEIDGLIDGARFNADDEKRRAQYRQVERLVIERVCGTIPYVHVGLNFLISAQLVGFKENASGIDFQLPGEGVPEAWGLRAE